MKLSYDTQLCAIDAIVEEARKRIPRFAFEYLDGGCNEDVNLAKNTSEIRDLELIPNYFKKIKNPKINTKLWGVDYDAPFGISPVGLQGMIWPNSPVILAKAATEHRIPFILSTVSTASIEEIGDICEGRGWYQLYHPVEDKLRDDLLRRAKESGFEVLVLLCDVPTFGFRPRDIKNGLALPPRMTVRNIIDMLKRPNWLVNTLIHGRPSFKTMKRYMPKGLNLKELGQYMNQTFDGRLDPEKIKRLRDKWKGKLVIKGVASEQDAETAFKCGVDGLYVSNHGGRQLDAGESSIAPMIRIVKKYGKKAPVMIDSGVRTGPDIARCLAAGAQFVFMGRTFMYGVSALGSSGGQHIISLLKVQLQQILDQLRCEKISDLPKFLKK